MAQHPDRSGNRPDVLDLRIFCAAVRSSSFKEAARALSITPTYVSKRIAALEHELGVVLFRRTTRQVHVTNEGELAYTWARKILDDLVSMVDEVSSTRRSPRGPLRIATSLRLGRDHVAPIMSLLARQYPAMEIWLELVDRRVDLVAEEFDVDVRVGDVTEPHLVGHRVVRSKRILCAAPGYLRRHGAPRTLADLADHQCLQFRDRLLPFGVWRLIGPAGEEQVKVTGTLGSNHSDIVLRWALDGLGIILVSEWDIASRIEDGSMARVLEAYHQGGDVWAVTSARLSASAKVRVCIEFLSKHLTEGPFALKVSGR